MLNESIVEDAALEWFADLGYTIGHGPHLAHAGGTLTRPLPPATSTSLRFPSGEEVDRLRQAIHRLNPTIPAETREDALRKVLRLGTPSLTQTNRVPFRH